MKLNLDKIYFSFADGVLDYKCAECTAFCCRGFGMQISVSRDLPLMKKHYPEVASLAFWRDGDQLFLTTPVTGCTLLQGTFCGFEQKLGKDHKPVGCTLFPFNNLFYVGNTLVVAVHHVCPLQLTIPARPGAVQGTHSAIASTIRDLGICADKVMPSWVSELKLPQGESGATFLKRESSFRDRCVSGLGRERFSAVLAEWSEDAKALRSFGKRVASLMQWNPKGTRVPDDIDNFLLTLAPTFRILESDRDPEHQLRLLTLLESHARFAYSLSAEPIGLRSLYGLFLQRRNAFRFLAYDEARLKPGDKNPVGVTAPENSMAQAAALRRIPTDGVLPGLEKAFQMVKSPSDRATIVNNLVSGTWNRA
jgi:hypothetical protein